MWTFFIPPKISILFMLAYYITLVLLCQYLFEKIFDFFNLPASNLSFSLIFAVFSFSYSFAISHFSQRGKV